MHDAAATGFERGAGDYERSRPSYPAEAVTTLAAQLDLRPGRTVVDLAAGTGKLSRLLLPTGSRLVAVEPVAGMVAQLRAAVPAAPVVAGTAEALPLRSSSVDAVTVAQAFHWFRADEARAEIHRVLRPGGGLALVWNSRDESVPWVARFSEILAPHEGDVPRQARNRGRDGFERSPLFSPLEAARFSFEQPMDADLLVGRAASISFIAALEPDLRARVLDQVRALAGDLPPQFGLPYVTDVYWCRARS